MMLVLLVMIRVAVVALVPVAMGTVAAAVLVSLADSLGCIGAISAIPVAEPNFIGREEKGAGVGAGEESEALIGTVAFAFARR